MIRHKSDWGAIILCDQRFSSSNVTSQLPSWVRPYATNHANFGLGLKSLVGFFKEAKTSFPPPSKVNKNVKVKDGNCNEMGGGCGGRGGGGTRNGSGGSGVVNGASSCGGDAFSYQKRSSSSVSSSLAKSNSVDHHVPSLDVRRRYEDELRSDISTPPQTQPTVRKRPLKIEYDDDREVEKKPSQEKKPSLSSVFDALDGGTTTISSSSASTFRKVSAGLEEKSAAEVALERRMANQQAKKRIKVAPGGGGGGGIVGGGGGGKGGGLKESLINQVLKKTVGVVKPLKTSTPKRQEFRLVSYCH